MPELPEVETVRRGLNSLIIGRKIKTITNDNPKSFPNTEVDVSSFAIGASVVNVRRRAKVLMIDLLSSYTFVIHLKMTGQLVFVGESTETGRAAILSSGAALRVTESQPVALGSPLAGTSPSYKVAARPDSDSPEVRFGAGHPSDSLVGNLPDKSTRVVITFEDGSRLFFNDQRKFGWMRLMPTLEVENIDFMKKVGPEPLEDDFTAEQFAERFKRRPRTNIKAALLDQTVVAGAGNIYADESLWGAKIHPQTLVGDVPESKLHILYRELRAVLTLAIDKGGSTNRNYVNAEGKKGSYMDFARVFRREGQACPRCGEVIIKLKVAGRGTHICPRCQNL